MHRQWFPSNHQGRCKYEANALTTNGKLYAPPFDADFVLGICICARCARSVLWTSSQPSAIMPDGCPPCDTILAMFGANAHQWERSAMAHLVRGTAVIWHCPASVATQRHATSAASCGNGPTHCPRVERHLQHLAPQHEVDHNEPLELIVAHVTV